MTAGAARERFAVAIFVVAVGSCGGERALPEPGHKEGAHAAAARPPEAPPFAGGAAGSTAAPVDPGPPPGGFSGTAGYGDAGSGGAAGMEEPPASPGGIAPPPPAFCDGMPKKALPYAIEADFQIPLVINSPASWSVVQGADCAQSVFPDVAAADAGAVDGGAASDGGWSAAPPSAADGGAPVTSCVAFRYLPDDCVASVGPLVDAGLAANPGVTCWAGVIFTATPAGISAPGICIAPGATAVHFKARASREGARVKFGSIREGLATTEFYILLTTTWTDYTVSIPAGEDYDGESPSGGVWNGFSVVAEPADHVGGTYIFVSDVVWAAQ